MSEWMDRLIKKHTCGFCDKKLNKKEIYTINMDTGEGPHKMTSCETCAMEFNDVLVELEKIFNGKE